MRIAKPPVPSGAGELFYTLRSCSGLRLLQKKYFPEIFGFREVSALYYFILYLCLLL